MKLICRNIVHPLTIITIDLKTFIFRRAFIGITKYICDEKVRVQLLCVVEIIGCGLFPPQTVRRAELKMIVWDTLLPYNFATQGS